MSSPTDMVSPTKSASAAPLPVLDSNLLRSLTSVHLPPPPSSGSKPDLAKRDDAYFYTPAQSHWHDPADADIYARAKQRSSPYVLQDVSQTVLNTPPSSQARPGSRIAMFTNSANVHTTPTMRRMGYNSFQATPGQTQGQNFYSDKENLGYPVPPTHLMMSPAGSSPLYERKPSNSANAYPVMSRQVQSLGPPTFNPAALVKQGNAVHSSPISQPAQISQPSQSPRFASLPSHSVQALAPRSTSTPIDEKTLAGEMPALVDDGTKPQFSYAQLIGMAILRSKDRKLTLAQIYQWITDTFSYYRNNKNRWHNSIRHNLSLNKAFQKEERPREVPGKGSYWVVVPGCEGPFLKGQKNAKRSASHNPIVMEQSLVASHFARASFPVARSEEMARSHGPPPLPTDVVMPLSISNGKAQPTPPKTRESNSTDIEIDDDDEDDDEDDVESPVNYGTEQTTQEDPMAGSLTDSMHVIPSSLGSNLADYDRTAMVDDGEHEGDNEEDDTIRPLQPPSTFFRDDTNVFDDASLYDERFPSPLKRSNTAIGLQHFSSTNLTGDSPVRKRRTSGLLLSDSKKRRIAEGTLDVDDIPVLPPTQWAVLTHDENRPLSHDEFVEQLSGSPTTPLRKPSLMLGEFKSTAVILGPNVTVVGGQNAGQLGTPLAKQASPGTGSLSALRSHMSPTRLDDLMSSPSSRNAFRLVHDEDDVISRACFGSPDKRDALRRQYFEHSGVSGFDGLQRVTDVFGVDICQVVRREVESGTGADDEGAGSAPESLLSVLRETPIRKSVVDLLRFDSPIRSDVFSPFRARLQERRD